MQSEKKASKEVASPSALTPLITEASLAMQADSTPGEFSF